MAPNKSAALANNANAVRLAPMKKVARAKSHKNDSLLFKPEVLDRSGLSYPNIWQKMRDGTFPLSIKVGAKVAWYASEFEAWLATLPRSRLKGDEAA